MELREAELREVLRNLAPPCLQQAWTEVLVCLLGVGKAQGPLLQSPLFQKRVPQPQLLPDLLPDTVQDH